MMTRTVFITPDTPLQPVTDADRPLTAGGFLKNLLALGSVFWAGYLWLVLAA